MNNQRALLDKLMGSDRNMNEKQRKENRRNRRYKRWYDESVCPYYLCGLCPYTLFFNTKCDLGDCGLEHDHDAFYDFSKQKPSTKRPIERKAITFYKQLLERVDWWIRQTQRKIELKEDLNEIDEERIEERRKIIKDEIAAQEKKIKLKEQEIERLGENGQIEKAQSLLTETETLKVQVQKLKETKIERYNNVNIACEICGGQIYKGQASRDDLHRDGRRHQGFLKIRQKIESLKRFRLRATSGSNSSRSRSYSQSRTRWTSSSRSVSRSRSRSRHRRESSPSSSSSEEGS